MRIGFMSGGSSISETGFPEKMSIFIRLAAAGDPERRIDRVTLGVFTVMVEAGKRTGLSSCFRDPPGLAEMDIPDAGNLTGKPLRALTGLYHGSGLLRHSLALAALNASLEPPPGNALVLLQGQDFLQRVTGDGHLVVVGHFPFVRPLSGRVGRLTVIQEPPHLGDRGVASARTVFPEADVIVITASALINHTMDDLLAAAGSAYVVVLGATTPMHSLMFEYGVDALCGARPVHPGRLLQGITQGASFRHLQGFERVTWFRNPRDRVFSEPVNEPSGAV